MDERTEEKLVVSCRDGDKCAYASLVRRYAQMVFATCLGVVGRVHDAEDITQEALVKGFTRISELRDGKRFASWISGIARNLCIDFLRRAKRDREILADQAKRERIERDDYSDLEQAISRMPERYRLPLMLYYFDGQSTVGVAEALDLTQATVCTRLSRARKELRKLLSEQGVNDE